jgi:3-phenylpropionate/trans-cinnamate dioxygenase ferredoxin subunit
MKYVTAALTADVAPGAMRAVEVEGQELLLANVGGSFYALSRACTHMGANLCEGQLDGKVVTCPRHGARFDVTSGQAVGKAKLLFLSTMPKNLASFPVKIEGAEILIGLP